MVELEIDGKKPESLWDPWTGFYPVRKDRWVNIHCNFPAHRAAMASVTGIDHETARVERAARGIRISSVA